MSHESECFCLRCVRERGDGTTTAMGFLCRPRCTPCSSVSVAATKGVRTVMTTGMPAPGATSPVRSVVGTERPQIQSKTMSSNSPCSDSKPRVKRARDLTRKEFEAALQRNGMCPSPFGAGYVCVYRAPLTHVYPGNAGPYRRDQLAYLIEQQEQMRQGSQIDAFGVVSSFYGTF